jgi:hypothetical protein
VAAFVEGVDTSITRRGGELRFAIPTSAVSDTQVEGAGFGVEYGRAVSGVINSTIKTGTNAFHGEGLYIGQNTKWRGASNSRVMNRSCLPGSAVTTKTIAHAYTLLIVPSRNRYG